MVLELQKIGTTLVSRQAGREALAAIQPILSSLKKNEVLEVSFDGVVTFSPSWADEFITPLEQQFGKRLKLHSTDNPSVVATLDFLGSIHHPKDPHRHNAVA